MAGDPSVVCRMDFIRSCLTFERNNLRDRQRLRARLKNAVGSIPKFAKPLLNTTPNVPLSSEAVRQP
jgi:hypothetical protein